MAIDPKDCSHCRHKTHTEITSTEIIEDSICCHCGQTFRNVYPKYAHNVTYVDPKHGPYEPKYVMTL